MIQALHFTGFMKFGSLLVALSAFLSCGAVADTVPYVDHPYGQEISHHFTLEDGLPPGGIKTIEFNSKGDPIVRTDLGGARYTDGEWESFDSVDPSATWPFERPLGLRLNHLSMSETGAMLAAGRDGLYERRKGGKWIKLEVKDGLGRRWGGDDVRAAIYDSQGRLWFGVLAGLACREADGQWRFYEGADGLPYNEFTCAAAGNDGSIWLGTSKGVIRLNAGRWHYRQGKRWLLDDEVHSIAIDGSGTAWIGTKGGVSKIEFRAMTLGQKAEIYEEEIDRLIKRTPYGYLAPVRLKAPGDRSDSIKGDNDNDGLWTSMYGAGQCFAFAATGKIEARDRARQAFEALRFLQRVTQGGEPSPPNGYVARSIRSTDLPDPNIGRVERDRVKRATDDRLWKVYEPRWPKSEDGRWYWKSDTSSDELDGHYFFYGLYYDLVAGTDAEKEEVRAVVRALTNHLIENDFNLTDHDGKPTRWGFFGPRSMNHDENWQVERGLNSLSLLSYLTVAEHVTGDAVYSETLRELRDVHAYDANAMVPKIQRGIGSGNQSDDEMAFMGFYDLLRYSKDQHFRGRLLKAFYPYWTLEQPELNPFFNFVYAACGRGKEVGDPWGVHSVEPWTGWLDESIGSLRAFSLDRANWAHSNSHRLDLIRLPRQQSIDPFSLSTRDRGVRVNGKALPVDERHFNHWNTDAFQLDYGGDGSVLACGTVFLLPYYMGLYHGFIESP